MALFDKFINPTVKGKKITSKILENYKYLITQTINRYKTSLNMALNGYRVDLYKLYNDSLRDNHLAGIIDLRKERVLGTSFNVYNKDGSVYDKDTFESKWFYDFLRMALDEIYWGFSLIQIDGIKDSNIYDITQVPHENVDIETSELIPNTNMLSDNINYATPSYNKWLLEIVDDVKNLGILSDVVPLVIWKRSAMSAWSEYTEIFGQPIRIGKTTSNIEQDRQRLASFLKGLASSAWAVIDESESIEFVEQNNSDAYNIYDKFIEVINKELSKRIIGSTEITDSSSGSGYAQSVTHNTQFSLKIKSDIRKMEFIIKDILLPKLVNLNIIPEGLVFKFDDFEQIGK